MRLGLNWERGERGRGYEDYEEKGRGKVKRRARIKVEGKVDAVPLHTVQGTKREGRTLEGGTLARGTSSEGGEQLSVEVTFGDAPNHHVGKVPFFGLSLRSMWLLEGYVHWRQAYRSAVDPTISPSRRQPPPIDGAAGGDRDWRGRVLKEAGLGLGPRQTPIFGSQQRLPSQPLRSVADYE